MPSTSKSGVNRLTLSKKVNNKKRKSYSMGSTNTGLRPRRKPTKRKR